VLKLEFVEKAWASLVVAIAATLVLASDGL